MQVSPRRSIRVSVFLAAVTRPGGTTSAFRTFFEARFPVGGVLCVACNLHVIVSAVPSRFFILYWFAIAWSMPI
jgi:hypothetical protein